MENNLKYLIVDNAKLFFKMQFAMIFKKDRIVLVRIRRKYLIFVAFMFGFAGGFGLILFLIGLLGSYIYLKFFQNKKNKLRKKHNIIEKFINLSNEEMLSLNKKNDHIMYSEISNIVMKKKNSVFQSGLLVITTNKKQNFILESYQTFEDCEEIVKEFLSEKMNN
ncbi:hypothetical protein HOD05_03330 [Candidatus Woesearchaeota archaeon]|nr:hypothetical protein [Candidatus Woesearchaeota archaeon]MBT4151406.1 hypothetical protein [Candidatus Woesearchaeota archaeon]MBT4247804.1 hypothetical protein [Candidatus Woesearchaeota archaeon]MBT4434228.1 hypothetical protein [Candidatus Woesearchaeota archaeon]MBT7332050.1 hypothetical protein [Candidatus Woesearchaeota archaeon]